MTQKPNKRRSTKDADFLAQGDDRAQNFTDTDPWRVMRVMSEFVDGFDAMVEVGPAITVFGSARTKADHPEYLAAVELGRRLGEEGYTIITGGGPGIMRAANQGAREAGAHSVGLNIELPFEQHVNPYVDISVDFRYFFVRKTMLVKYARGFVIFPGGFGTLDEFFEALTLIQTGKIHDFPVVLIGKAYWQGLFDWVRSTLLAGGKVNDLDLDLVHITDDIEDAVQRILRSKDGDPERRAQEDACAEETATALTENG